MAKEFTDSEMDNLLAQESLIVIDFWAEWCGPCKKLSPVIDELAEEYDGVVDIRKCDVEENVEVASKFGVMAIPTIVLVKNGRRGLCAVAIFRVGEDKRGKRKVNNAVWRKVQACAGAGRR